MEYDVIYSDRRTLALTIKNGRLLVRAPRRTTAEKIEQAIDSHRKWIEKHLEKQKHKVDLTASLTDEQIRELRRTARRVLTCKTEYFSKIMGLKYGRISITGAKTRFGSCNSKGNISYSYRLMLYPLGDYRLIGIARIFHNYSVLYLESCSIKIFHICHSFNSLARRL